MKNTTIITWEEVNGMQLMVAKSAGKLEKLNELPIADHGSHLLPEGIYEFYIQNSYNPYTKLMEQVID